MISFPNGRCLCASNRRGFLKGAGALAAASTALPIVGRAAPVRPKLHLLAEGVVGLGAVVPQPDLSSLPSDILQQILSGVLQIRQRVTFPIGEQEDDVLSIQVFIVPFDAPIPLPAAPPVPPGPDDPVTISQFQLEIARILLSDKPTPNLALLGTVIAEPVASPFGDLMGRVAAVGAGYDHAGENVDFVMLGGFVGGSHSTWSFTATGSLVIGH